MKYLIRSAVGLSVLMLLVSCGTGSLESRGHQAFEKATKASGAEKRRLNKTAYKYYLEAVKHYDDKSRINNKLRNRFIEATLIRGNLILDEATASMDALDLFVRDIDTLLTSDVNPDLVHQYGSFLGRLADSARVRDQMFLAMKFMDKALNLPGGHAQLQQQKTSLVDRYVQENVDLANEYYEMAQETKDNTEDMIRAEYYANLALHFDPENTEAMELREKIRDKNVNVYSAYDAVIEDKPDTNIYKLINKYDILMAVERVKRSGGGVSLTANIYNYSYNPLRLWPKNFYLVDEEGNRYQARPGSRISKEILDQEHECKNMVLLFPSPKAPIEKLVFDHDTEYGKHYSEKYL